MAGFDDIQALTAQSRLPLGIGNTTGRDPFAIDGSDQKGGFSQALGEAVHNFGSVQKGAQAALHHVARGSDGEVHDSMMAIEKANTTFKFGFTCVKRAIECYKELTQRMG